MLKKNVYILYPAGYYGTYINWSINISDADRKESTVKNPINKEDSDNLGGVGTSHHHVKVPTHQGFLSHFTWILYNKPQDYRIYNINQGTDVPMPAERFIAAILNGDPDSVFINIHNDNNYDITCFGSINAMTKWPTQMAIRKNFELFGTKSKLYGFDPFNCAGDLNFRNLVAEDHAVLLRKQIPLDSQRLEQFVRHDKGWYDIRNKMQPHEINEETYINPDSYISGDAYKERIFELSCRDVVSGEFPEFIKSFLEKSNASTSFNTEYLADFHQQFIDAQPNLQWFESINQWRMTKEIDTYLMSHMGIQGLLLAEMLATYPGLKDSNWKEKSINDINDSIKMLDRAV